MPLYRARLTCAQCLEHSWLKQDTKNMEAKQLSKERMKKYILRRRWQVKALAFILIYLLDKESISMSYMGNRFLHVCECLCRKQGMQCEPSPGSALWGCWEESVQRKVPRLMVKVQQPVFNIDAEHCILNVIYVKMLITH